VPDENDHRTESGNNASSELPAKRKHVVNPFAKLTDDDWQEATIRGQLVSEARDAAIGAAIRRGCESSIAAAGEALGKAEAALRTYLERPDSEPEDKPRHRELAADLKTATDLLKRATDEYFVLVSNWAGSR
jgi:hypothetical protein